MTSTVPSRWRPLFFAIVIAMQWQVPVNAQPFDEQFSHWPVNLTIHGRILIDNGIEDWDDLMPVLERVTRDRSVVCFQREAARSSKRLTDALNAAVGDNGSVEATSFTAIPLDELKSAFSLADVVVIQAGEVMASDLPTLLKLKPQFDQFLSEGRTLVVDQAIATLLGKVVLSKTLPKGDDAGLNLFPDSILLCNFDGNEESQADLLNAVTVQPASVPAIDHWSHGALCLLVTETQSAAFLVTRISVTVQRDCVPKNPVFMCGANRRLKNSPIRDPNHPVSDHEDC